jgi:hypothetical protein
MALALARATLGPAIPKNGMTSIFITSTAQHCGLGVELVAMVARSSDPSLHERFYRWYVIILRGSSCLMMLAMQIQSGRLDPERFAPKCAHHAVL